jgi:hypothetical protein
LAELGVAKKAMSDAVASGQKPNVMDQIRLVTMQEQADRLGALARAEGSPEAEIPEEMRAAFEGRQARIARREELLAEARARSPWEALIAGGAAAVEGRRGERWTDALARGLQAGVQQYGRSRQELEEGAESIAEARDQAIMDRYTMREQAVANARQRALEMMGIGDTARDRAVANIRLPVQIGTEQAAADLAQFKLEKAPEEFATEQDVRKATADYYRNYRGRGGAGGGGASNTKGLSTLLTSLDREAVQLGRITTSITTPSKEKFAAAQRLAEVNAERQRIRAEIAQGRLGGATPAASRPPSERIGEYVMGVGYKPPK